MIHWTKTLHFKYDSDKTEAELEYIYLKLLNSQTSPGSTFTKTLRQILLQTSFGFKMNFAVCLTLKKEKGSYEDWVMQYSFNFLTSGS